MDKLVLILMKSEDGQLQAHIAVGGKQASFASEEPDPEDRDLQKSFKACNFYDALRCSLQAEFSPETCEDEFKKSHRLFLK